MLICLSRLPFLWLLAVKCHITKALVTNVCGNISPVPWFLARWGRGASKNVVGLQNKINFVVKL